MCQSCGSESTTQTTCWPEGVDSTIRTFGAFKVRDCAGNGGCNHPFNGTTSGRVKPSHQAIADVSNAAIKPLLCSVTGRNHEIICNRLLNVLIKEE